MMTIASTNISRLLSEILDDCPKIDDFTDRSISGIASNSLDVKNGYLFVALSGMQVHGIDYAINAVKSGAVAVVYDQDDEYSKRRIALLKKQVKTDWIGIGDLDIQTGIIASRFFGCPGQALNIIGVTGTDGKTSVTHLICQALTQMGRRVASIGTLGYGLVDQLEPASHTTPDAITLQSLLARYRDLKCDTVVMEVSSHALQQYRVNGCQFDIAVLTNLGRDHLDYHGSMECYAAAKARLFYQFELSGKVVNAADQFGQKLLEQLSDDGLVRYSSQSDSSDDVDVVLTQFRATDHGQSLEIKTPKGILNLETELIGDFNRENTLACISSLFALGLNLSEIQRATLQLKPIPGRMELMIPQTNNIARVVVDFAHTEQALRACLTASRDYCKARLWCIFGCGGDRDQGKRPKMGQAAEALADRVIITDDNPRTESPEKIVAEILQGLVHPDRVSVVHDRRAAIEFALAEAAPDDLIVITGKGHEQDQIVGTERLPFNDRRVVKQLYRRLQ
jgi:UDP-N-acetylmuramoyl-L-alanyl-D-glutamate--2,6-diaminopimelate ligase